MGVRVRVRVKGRGRGRGRVAEYPVEARLAELDFGAELLVDVHTECRGGVDGSDVLQRLDLQVHARHMHMHMRCTCAP